MLPLMPQKNRRLRAPCIAFAPKKSNENKTFFFMCVIPCLNYHNLAILSHLQKFHIQINKFTQTQHWCFPISLLPIKNMADHSWSFSWVLTIQYFSHFFVIQLTVHWGMEAVSDAFLLM